jgi:hypothetical protein
VLRYFGGTRKRAREQYQLFMKAGRNLGHQEEYYGAEAGRVLGSEEFVEATLHRIGEVNVERQGGGRSARKGTEDGRRLVRAVEQATGLSRREFCSGSRGRELVRARELLIAVGREEGWSYGQLAKVVGLESSAVSRRHEAARCLEKKSGEFRMMLRKIRAVIESERKQ